MKMDICSILIQKTDLESFWDSTFSSSGPKSAIDNNSSTCKYTKKIDIKGTVLNLLCSYLYKKQTQNIFFYMLEYSEKPFQNTLFLHLHFTTAKYTLGYNSSLAVRWNYITSDLMNFLVSNSARKHYPSCLGSLCQIV